VEQGAETRRRPVQLFVTLIPLWLAALAVSGWLWYRDRPSAPPARPTAIGVIAPADPAMPTLPADTPGDGFGLVSGAATPWAVAGGPGEVLSSATPERAATAVPAAMVLTLLGPPPGSAFRVEDVMSFYWSAPVAPAPGQQFVVYLLVDGERLALGAVPEANLGRGFQLSSAVGSVAGLPGSYSWLVVLEDSTTGNIIGQSEIRPLMLIGDN
jgi:hypothetical protein